MVTVVIVEILEMIKAIKCTGADRGQIQVDCGGDTGRVQKMRFHLLANEYSQSDRKMNGWVGERQTQSYRTINSLHFYSTAQIKYRLSVLLIIYPNTVHSTSTNFQSLFQALGMQPCPADP